MGAASSQELKQLTSRRARLTTEMAEFKALLSEYQGKYNEAKGKVKTIDERMLSLKVINPVITEHAILRYIERATDFNIEEVKSKLLSAKTKEAIKTLGNGRYPIGKGLFIVVKDMAIVSLIDKENKLD